MNSLKLFEGIVSHSRSSPVDHTFTYRMFQIWVDLKKTTEIDSISRWWSTKTFNLVRFKRQNYLPSEKSLYDEACSTIKLHTGNNFSGDAFLLANLSYWGTCFNPIVFIACYEGNELRYLITEVHNTPWNERFVYVHDTHANDKKGDSKGYHQANFDKAFHVSPFMPMNLQYRWKYRIGESSFFIKMTLQQKGQSLFNATMKLNGTQLNRQQANLLPFRYPMICAKVIAAIYWQALKLWLKRVPIFRHPK